MNNNIVLTNILRFLGIFIIQVLILKRISPDAGIFMYISVFLYPILLILLPLRTPHTLQIGIGFVLGILLDIFYDSLGIHASACVFTAFIRPYVLAILQPRVGYNVNHSPTKHRFGINWFLIYAGIMLFFHLFFYFSVDAFTFVYIGDIFLRTVFSFIISMLAITMYIYILNPED